MAAPVACKDCRSEGITTKRKAPHQGPRCVSHHRERRAALREAAWEKRLIATYGITAAEYWQIYEQQNGVCYICERATGTGRRRLSVDHCHKTGVVRGLLCSADNKSVLGHLRDSEEALQRAIDYLRSPPAVRAIGKRITPDVLREHLTKNGQ